MKKRPHIIIFNPDEMRADALHHLGNPAALTPHLDAFAEREAVSFSGAYCQNPVCVPSRCSFFTGLYPHTRGHRTMAHLLHPGESSLLKELKDAGYYVWMNDRNDLTAGDIPGWTESHATEIYYGGQKASLSHGEHPRGVPGNPYYYAHFDGRIASEGAFCSADDEIVDAAVERIRSRDKDKPLCMFLGLMYPHVPYTVEEPYYSAIDRKKLPRRIRQEECRGKSVMLGELKKNVGMDAFTQEEWDELRAVYLGMCMKVDEQFGRLLEVLREEGIYDDCAIFFLSDHGDFTGDYDLPEKAQNTFENCLTRVPLLIKPPREIPVDPGVCTALTELVDFYATAMDLAGVKPDHTHFGRSLREQLSDRSLPGREFVFCEGGRNPGEEHCDEYHTPRGTMSEKSAYWPKARAQSEDAAHDKAVMIFDGRYKYISRTLGKDEFYDLSEDPGERVNRAEESASAAEILRLKDQMLRWMIRTSDVVPLHRDSRFTPKMMWARCRPLVPPEKEKEVRKMIAEGIDFVALMQYCRSLGQKKLPEVNPYLPSYEYVPDAEPYVFGDRLYVFGSHDRFHGESFCVNDYVGWSCPADDLSDWRCEGILYRKTQDPYYSEDGDCRLFAPDVMQGPDGRYYLYYSFSHHGTIGVAVCDEPAGKYEYYGHVHHPDGTLYGEKEGDMFQYDPGVFPDEDGRYWLYTGFCFNAQAIPKFRSLKENKKGAMAAELQPDMVTLKEGPRFIVPSEFNAEGTGFEGHAFFEASSMRKINGIYYFIYSSQQGHELCYATSRCPDRDFSYGGCIVSNGDIGYQGRTETLNYTGTNHGSIVKIKDLWYVFYHRQTGGTPFSRQGCAERIEILPDGSILQVRITSCGLSSEPLPMDGHYPAGIASCLMSGEGAVPYSVATQLEDHHPYITQSGTDREYGPDQFIVNMRDGAKAGFRSFRLPETTEKPAAVEKPAAQVSAAASGKSPVAVEKPAAAHMSAAEGIRLTAQTRGSARGRLLIRDDLDGRLLGEAVVLPSDEWADTSCRLDLSGSREQRDGLDLSGSREQQDGLDLWFEYRGEGSMDLHGFAFSADH